MFLKKLQFNITFDHFKNWPPKTGLRWDPEIHSARKVLDVCEFRFTSVYTLPSSAFGIGCTMLYLPRPHVVNASTPGWSLNCSRNCRIVLHWKRSSQMWSIWSLITHKVNPINKPWLLVVGVATSRWPSGWVSPGHLPRESPAPAMGSLGAMSQGSHLPCLACEKGLKEGLCCWY